MDNLFIGNIVQRTWEETESDGITATGKVHDYILKQDAILYKTKNTGRDSTLGVFVDSDTLKPYSVYIDTQNSSQNLSR